MKHFPQLLLGVRQNVFLPCGQSRTGSINVKIQHGHCRLERRAFAAAAAFGGPLQGQRNLPRIAQFEHAFLQIQGIAVTRDRSGPPALSFRVHVCLRPLEKMHLQQAFVMLDRLFKRVECSQVPAFAAFRFPFARIQAVLAILKFSYHTFSFGLLDRRTFGLN